MMTIHRMTSGNPITDAIWWGPSRIEDYVAARIREHSEKCAREAMRRREIEAMKIMAYLVEPMEFVVRQGDE